MTYATTPNIAELDLLKLLENNAQSKRPYFLLGNIGDKFALKFPYKQGLFLGPKNIITISEIFGVSYLTLFRHINVKNTPFEFQLDAASLGRLQNMLKPKLRNQKLLTLGI